MDPGRGRRARAVARARPCASAYAACLCVALLAGCGDEAKEIAEPSTTTTAPATTTATTAPTSTEPPTVATATNPVGLEIGVSVYFVRDGRVSPVKRWVPETRAIGQAALDQLARGPTAAERAAGLSTGIGRLPLSGLRIENGEADLGELTHVSQLAQAQIVFTLTQFRAVREVRIGDDVLDRGDLEDVTPAILVEAPLPGEPVASPIRVRGTSNTFEATMRVEIRRGSRTLAEETVTASSGSGERGTFDATIDVSAPPGPITLVAFEPSAEDGSALHTVEIPLTLR